MTSSQCLTPQQAPGAQCHSDDQEGQGQKRAEGEEREAERWCLPPPLSPMEPAAGLTNLTATRGNTHCPLSQERPASQPWLFYYFLFFSFIFWLYFTPPSKSAHSCFARHRFGGSRAFGSPPGARPSPPPHLCPNRASLWPPSLPPHSDSAAGGSRFLLSCFVGFLVGVMSH